MKKATVNEAFLATQEGPGATTLGATLATLPREAAFDQAQLFEIGLAHLQRLARQGWTDHNSHDPGITLLETLCYAATELSYRADFPVADLLAPPPGTPAAPFSAAALLCQGPLTELDYRRLLIDLPGVKNAWLEPADLELHVDLDQRRLGWQKPGHPATRPVQVRGRFRVLLDFEENALSPGEQAAIEAAAMALLAANRNLGELCVGVSAVPTQDFVICAQLEAHPEIDSARLEAEILMAVDRYLDPPILPRSLAESLARLADGSGADELFAGPRLNHGLLEAQEVAAAQLRRELRLSDILSEVMDLPGILAVRDFVINPANLTESLADRWQVPVAAGHRPRLAEQHCHCVFYKRGVPIRNRPAAVGAHLEQLRAERRALFFAHGPADWPVPVGQARQLAHYRPLRHHLPATYGVGHEGPQIHPDPALHRQRLALAAQLRAYLLFFDQILAQGSAQLAALPELFDPLRVDGATYAPAQVDPTDAVWLSDAAAQLAEVESEETRIDRRNRLLNHWLARYAEQFQDYVEVMRSLFGASTASVLRAKSQFLADYAALGAERGLGYDPSQPVWDTNNLSGLERRLARLLDLPLTTRTTLQPPTLGDDLVITQRGTGGHRFTLFDREKDPPSLLLLSHLRYAEAAEAQAAGLEALRLAQDRACYRRTEENGKFTFHLVDTQDALLAEHRQQDSLGRLSTKIFYDSAAERETAIDRLVEYARRYYSGEGLLLIENLLLLPADGEEAFLPICVDPDCDDCPSSSTFHTDDDPYSFRVQVLLPAEAGRFANLDFRRYVESVIREEMPAHLLPKICWLAWPTLEEVQQAYRVWLEQGIGLATLVDALSRAKNHYPSEKLGAPESPQAFQLGRTALGQG